MSALLRRYHALVLVVVTVVYFTNVPGYSSVIESGVPRVFDIYFFLLLLLPVALQAVLEQRRLRDIAANPLMYWCYAFALLTLAWFFLSGRSAVESQVFKTRFVSLVYVLGLVVLFSTSWAHELARKAIAVAVLLGVALNILDFTSPGVLVPVDLEFANPGRAAGLYMNANRAGFALVLGFVVAWGVVPPRWRAPFLLVVGVGIVLTFSRSAILALVIAILLLGRYGWVCWREIRTAAGAGLAAAVLFSFAVLPQLDSGWLLLVNAENLTERLDYFTHPLTALDASATERELVAWRGLRYFGESPLIGHGIGFTHAWRFPASTHNMYLTLAVEYGFLGLLVFPLLIVALVSRTGLHARPWVVTSAGVIAFVAFFTHNALDEFAFLIVYALTALSRLSDQPFESARSARPGPLE